MALIDRKMAVSIPCPSIPPPDVTKGIDDPVMEHAQDPSSEVESHKDAYEDIFDLASSDVTKKDEPPITAIGSGSQRELNHHFITYLGLNMDIKVRR